MKLYKFVTSKSAVINMARGNLKFAPIAELNDPLELFPDLVPADVNESLINLRKNGFTSDQFDWLGRQERLLDRLAPEHKALRRPATIDQANRMLSISAYDNLPFMRRRLVETIQTIRGQVGVLSLSDRWDSLVMWAHYAGNAQGFVVILDGLSQALVGDETGSLNTPKPVRYGSVFRGMTFDPATQDNLFFWKHADWSYEREWRVVVPLAECERLSGSLHVRQVESKHFAGVILGHNVPSGVAFEIARELKAITHHALTVLFAFVINMIEGTFFHDQDQKTTHESQKAA